MNLHDLVQRVAVNEILALIVDRGLADLACNLGRATIQPPVQDQTAADASA